VGGGSGPWVASAIPCWGGMGPVATSVCSQPVAALLGGKPVLSGSKRRRGSPGPSIASAGTGGWRRGGGDWGWADEGGGAGPGP